MAETDERTDLSDPEPSAVRPKRAATFIGRLAQALREQNWAAVGIELCIVVLGVVIGFQISAWGETRSDARREQAILRQLASDLEETESRMDGYMERYQEDIHPAMERLLDAWSSEERPPPDSVLAWLNAVDILSYQWPLRGTIRSLTMSGDLTLIRDDRLRNEIVEHLEWVEDGIDTQSKLYEAALRAREQIAERVDLLQGAEYEPIRILQFPRLIPPPDRTPPFPLDLDALFRDRGTYAALSNLALYHEFTDRITSAFHEESAELRERVETEIDP